MKGGLITLADLPELQGTERAPKATITIARLDDKLRDPRYGRFAITQKHYDGWKRNLSEVFGGQVSMDEDHSSDRGGGTRAIAWIDGLHQQGKLVQASVQFTPRGAKQVREGEYRYTSPTFVDDYVDEHGDHHGPALLGAAVTNRPVLRKGMPCLSLSRDEIEGAATVRTHSKRARKHARKLLAALPEEDAPASDSRDVDPKLTEIAKLLDLGEDADVVKILGGVTALAAGGEGGNEGGESGSGEAGTGAAGNTTKAARKAAKAARKAKKGPRAKAGKTLSEDEGGEGKITLSAEQYAELLTGANAGTAAALQLSEQTFDNAWQKALDEGRAAPVQEELLRTLWRENPELAVKTLDSFPRIVPTTPAGSGLGPTESGAAPAGNDPERFALDQEAKQLAKTLRRSDPNLSEADAYTDAIYQLAERDEGDRLQVVR